jgi:hypothetical protein
VASAVIVQRIVVVGEPCDAAFVAHLVDDILLPLLATFTGLTTGSSLAGLVGFRRE